MNESQLSWARYLVERGYSIIPTLPDTKVVLEQGWQYYNEHSPDNATLSRWFQSSGNNIALSTGLASGVIALEFSGREAMTAMRRLEKSTKELPPTLMIRKFQANWSPARGYDYGDYNVTYLYQFDEPVSSVRVNSSLAIKAERGYTMLPPSVVGGGPYEWYGDENQIAELPAAIAEWLMDKSRIAL